MGIAVDNCLAVGDRLPFKYNTASLYRQKPHDLAWLKLHNATDGQTDRQTRPCLLRHSLSTAHAR